MKTDRYRLKRIVAVGDQLLNVISLRDLTPETLLSDTQMQWMVTTPLYNIGEQANCISREFADAHPEVPFAQIAGLRHRLVHDYEGINWSIISSVLFDELETFVAQARDLIAELDEGESGPQEADFDEDVTS